MYSKSKLKFLLLASTFIFAVSPQFPLPAFLTTEPLYAQDMPGLDMLLDTPHRSGTAGQSDLNAAFAFQGDTGARSASWNVVKPVNAVGAGNIATSAAATPAVFSVPSGGAAQPFAIALKPEAPPIEAVPAINPFLDASTVVQRAEPAAIKPDEAQKVDDNALRYYAATNDLKRLGAEMRRLKQMYPDWQPPRDLFSTETRISEQPLWDIYKTGNYAAVRAKIAQTQAANPKWQPSDDLLSKLHRGEARTLIRRAYAQRNWNQVIATAGTVPDLLVCDEMEALWNVGEAFARQKNYAQAYELYSYILTGCTSESDRLSTVQKAALLLPSQGTTALITLGRIMPDGSSEFEDVSFNVTRNALSDFIRDGNFGIQPSEDDISRFVEFIDRRSSVDDANLVGWYFYAQEEWATANSWFLRASQFEKNSKSIEGVILTLRKLQQEDDALKVAKRYVGFSPDIQKQYIEIAASRLSDEENAKTMTDKELLELETFVAKQKSALGGQALGWKYLREGERISARKWFADSVAWEPNEGGVIGLAVLASRAKNYKELAMIKSKYGATYSDLSAFKIYKVRKGGVYKAEVPKKKRTLLDYLAPEKKKKGRTSRS